MSINVPAEVIERRKLLKDLFETAPIKHSLGMELHYDEQGSAVFDLPYNPGFDHFLGGIHGGVFATLLDNAGWFTAAAYYDNWISTVEFSVRLLEWAAKEPLQSRGWIVRSGSRIAVAQMEVKAAGRLVATGSGTFIVTDKPLRSSSV